MLQLSEIPWSFDLPRPNWSVIRRWVGEHIASDARPTAWDEAIFQWLEALNSALDGGFQVLSSEHFHFFLPVDYEHARFVAEFTEEIYDQIQIRLAEVARQNWPARLPILLLPGSEIYYEYLTRYYPDGEYGGSGGVCIADNDFAQIVIHGVEPGQIQPTIAHELTHAVVAHLDLPSWLEEGLTQWIEDDVRSRWSRFELTAKAAKEMREYWQGCGLNDFWWGRGYSLPDSGQSHSYDLSQVLMRLLMLDHRGQLLSFIGRAQNADAGESAAQECLRVSLNQLAAKFLGDGDWTPVPPDALSAALRAQFQIERNDFAAARADLECALSLDPRLESAYELRAHLHSEEADYPAAIADYTRSLALNPRSVSAMNGFAWLLATCPEDSLRDGPRAVEYADKACQRTGYAEPGWLDTLAAAYAETGDFEQAVHFQEDVVDRCPESYREDAQLRLELFRQQQPYRDTRTTADRRKLQER